MRKIDADRLKAILWQFVNKRMVTGFEWFFPLDYQEMLCLVDSMPTIPDPSPKWVDASKRLPDKEGNYIVYETQDKEVCESLYYPQAYFKKNRWMDPWEGCTVFSVSHWMEMPEPPEEVKHEIDRR